MQLISLNVRLIPKYCKQTSHEPEVEIEGNQSPGFWMALTGHPGKPQRSPGKSKWEPASQDLLQEGNAQFHGAGMYVGLSQKKEDPKWVVSFWCPLKPTQKGNFFQGHPLREGNMKCSGAHPGALLLP